MSRRVDRQHDVPGRHDDRRTERGAVHSQGSDEGGAQHDIEGGMRCRDLCEGALVPREDEEEPARPRRRSH